MTACLLVLHVVENVGHQKLCCCAHNESFEDIVSTKLGFTFLTALLSSSQPIYQYTLFNGFNYHDVASSSYSLNIIFPLAPLLEAQLLFIGNSPQRISNQVFQGKGILRALSTKTLRIRIPFYVS